MIEASPVSHVLLWSVVPSAVQIFRSGACRVEEKLKLSVGLSEWRERKVELEAMLEKGGGMRNIS